MRRWQRLGIFPNNPGYFPGYVHNMEKSISKLQMYGPGTDQRSARAYDLCDCSATAMLAHFEYNDHPFGDVIRYGRKATEIAVDFFYGDWREKYLYEYVPRTYLNRQQCLEKLDWLSRTVVA
jgi:hypothetical protein